MDNLPGLPTGETMKAHANLPKKVEGFLLFILLVFYACPIMAADATLSWDANSEPDVSGYGIYYQKNFQGPPYEIFSYMALQDLADPNNPSATLTGLEKDANYYFAVTAYDTEGYESFFSNSICARVGDTIAPCADSEGGSGGGSGGGSSGGGSGCFISMAAHEQIAVLPFSLAFLFMTFFVLITGRHRMR